MRIKGFKYFKSKNILESKKNKFPNIREINIDGFLVFIGKDAKSNDHLTFNVADEDDIWFHSKGVPGSHVVIRINDKLPTLEVLKEVAKLTKDNSKAKGSENVVIVYCKRKFVTKDSSMNVGQVRVDYRNSNEIII